MRTTGLIVRLSLVGMMILNSGMASTQNYPNKPVRLIVPPAPGGGMDIIARGVAQKLTESLGNAVIVDNRSGAGGSVGAEIIARAVPDG